MLLVDHGSGVQLKLVNIDQRISQLPDRHFALSSNIARLLQIHFQLSYNHSIVVLDTARLVYS